MSVKIQWPEFTFPPINLYNMPKLWYCSDEKLQALALRNVIFEDSPSLSVSKLANSTSTSTGRDIEEVVFNRGNS